MTQRSRFDLFPVSVHLFFRRGDSVLLLRRQGTGFCDGMYGVPAGHVTQAESVMQAAAREAAEEVGLVVDPKALRVVGTMYRCSTEARIDFFLEAGTWSGEPRNLEPHKCDALAWFRLPLLPQNTIPYLRRALTTVERPPWFEEYL
ncbi:MAG TPA: NUDIX domain-containing protein [Pyrinomonadaceae bacterium]|jgi:8-oxo-dGTP pyrophosphatase MutT (NUDIX family)